VADDLALSVRDLTKKYRLFSTPMERLKESLHPLRRTYHREFWALKGISFDVRKGQVVGILGPNGSGKSTLLQIIAAVLQPTSGTITVDGRVSALLELGAGFNPEFTGRQNVLLNGAIMGVRREELLERMPEIIAFADVGEFFDQPMKIYSSGMFVRVAFAATVHVDPEIFVVDEALAVGDAKFQHKCFQRFADLQAQHKTVILVTHNSSMVTNFCDTALLMNAGELVAAGDPSTIVDRYHELLFGGTAVQHANSTEDEEPPRYGEANGKLRDFADRSTEDVCSKRRSYNQGEVRFGNGGAKIIDYVIESGDGWDVSNVEFGATIALYFKVLFCRDVALPIVGFSVKTVEGVEIYGTNTFLMGVSIGRVSVGDTRTFRFAFSFRAKPSDYFLDLGVAETDGTRGGAVLDVRRSIGHCVVSLDRPRFFEGLVDLRPTFDVLNPTSAGDLVPGRTPDQTSPPFVHSS
jgi:ABC-type polysaccharide/polyol phosphate transport system ATPase subunit